MARTTHHCPKASKGGCRKAETPSRMPYCATHQTYCKVAGCSSEYPFLLGQGCNTCKGRAEQERKMKKEKKKAEDKAKKEKKELEERERREKEKARKPGMKK